MSDDQRQELEIVGEGRRLRLVRQGRREYVQRVGASGVVIVLALTDSQQVVFVEQYRQPVGARVIEFPAGLAGDLQGAEDESLEEAARRELLEETGYAAQVMQRLFDGPSAAGLTDERATFFLARQLSKPEPAEQQPDERLVVHEVPRPDVDAWLLSKRQAGCLIGARVLAGLYLLDF